MRPTLSKKEARAFRARWRAVEAAEAEDIRRTSIAVKLRQLAALMASATMFEGDEELEAEEDAVRERWARLRESLGA